MDGPELSLRDLQRLLGIVTSHATWALTAKRVKGRKTSRRDLESLKALWEKLARVVDHRTAEEQTQHDRREELARETI